MKNIILILIILLTISCENGKKAENAIVKSEAEAISNQKKFKDNKFKIILKLKIAENNRIDVFYIGDRPDGVFNDKELVSKYVSGNTEFQNVEFELPKDVLPYSLRIDLGENSIKTETPVEISSIRLIFNNNEIEIDNNTLEVFFQPNVYLEKISEGLYQRKIINEKFDPYLVSKAILNKKIEIEL